MIFPNAAALRQFCDGELSFSFWSKDHGPVFALCKYVHTTTAQRLVALMVYKYKSRKPVAEYVVPRSEAADMFRGVWEKVGLEGQTK